MTDRRKRNRFGVNVHKNSFLYFDPVYRFTYFTHIDSHIYIHIESIHIFTYKVYIYSHINILDTYFGSALYM